MFSAEADCLISGEIVLSRRVHIIIIIIIIIIIYIYIYIYIYIHTVNILL